MSRTTILIGLVAAAFIVGFGALVWIDSGQRQGNTPPEGVEEFDVSSGVNNHTQDPVAYEQDPPVGGPHNPVWQTQGFYDEPIRNENAVHDLEHGAVWITYSPDLPQDQKDTIKQIVESQDCLLASPYPNLPEDSPVVASAWGYQLKLTSADDPNLEKFVSAYRKGPQTPEPGATCAGGTSETTG
ncbi:MAG TPA: DUF3105 domain-containing protein [Rubrobacteraceae bacterium]|nr:DUF3105 domain-containing protein [Rubrobacteraceae bacterium]